MASRKAETIFRKVREEHLERLLSPWEVLAQLTEAGLLVERDGEYAYAPDSELESAADLLHREETRERVGRYRAALRANGESTKGGARFRKEVLARDGGRCVYCGSTRNLIVEHMWPVERGGRSVMENLVAGCRSCNGKKRNMTPDEAGLRFVSQPAEQLWRSVAATLPGGDGGDRLHQLPQSGTPVTPLVTPVSPQPTPVTPGRLHQLPHAPPNGQISHPNGLNGASSAQFAEGAYKEIERIPPPPRAAAAADLSLLASALPATGGPGGGDRVLGVLHAIKGFQPGDDDADRIARYAAEFPGVDLLVVAEEYAGTALNQPPSIVRFRKWVAKAASDPPRPSRAAPTSAAPIALRRKADFSR